MYVADYSCISFLGFTFIFKLIAIRDNEGHFYKVILRILNV